MGPFASYPSLSGRTVFITGGATGIGAALVQAFCAQGARVGFLDINAQAGAALSDPIPNAWFWHCDVTDPTALKTVLAAAEYELGPIRVLVNNVADDSRHAVEDLTPEAWRANLAVNLDPVLQASLAVQPGMRAAGGGSIINLSSINARLGPPDLAAYTAAKGAVDALGRSLARAWGGDNIRVNAVAPGWVVTERQLALWLTPEAENEWMKQVALRWRIEPPDIARLVLFLAADDSAMITGQVLTIDGGRT